MFCNLPPPVAQRAIVSIRNLGRPAAPPAAINMASFNNRDAGCFHEDCLVSMHGGVASKLMRDLQPGDKVHGGATVQCIVRMSCEDNSASMVHFESGLCLTPWHPIAINGKWVFPADIHTPVRTKCGAVYSLLLNCDSAVDGECCCSAVVVNGISCVTLAHGIENDAVASHPFFGTERVREHLRQYVGWIGGRISLPANCMIRDKLSGLISSFDKDAEILENAILTVM